MNKSPLFSSIALAPLSIVVFLTGCASNIPVLQSLPSAVQANIPTIPKNQDLSRSFIIYKTPTDKDKLAADVTKRNNFTVKADARVVISVPVEQQRKEKGKALRKNMSLNFRERETLGKKEIAELRGLEAEKNSGKAVFSTAEYFNKAEQEIEKSLLRKNFIVMDRSKFEAELRNRRDKDRDTQQSVAQQEEVKNLEELRDSKRITRDEFVQKLRDIESKYNIISEGNSRSAGNNELVDISELIRAAESGKIQADYILQVNSFDIGAISDTQLYVTENHKIKKLLLQHPNLANELENANAATIVQPGYFGYLNAKLIDVKTGSIVWVGEHRVESSNVEDIKINITMTKEVSNIPAVTDAVTNHNSLLGRKIYQARRVGASTQISGLDDNVQRRRLSNYNSLVSTIKSLNQGEAVVPTWRFAYSVAKPIIKPSFPSEYELRYLQRQSTHSQTAQNEFLKVRDRMGRHQSALAKLVSRELIMTIPSSD